MTVVDYSYSEGVGLFSAVPSKYKKFAAWNQYLKSHRKCLYKLAAKLFVKILICDILPHKFVS